MEQKGNKKKGQPRSHVWNIVLEISCMFAVAADWEDVTLECRVR